MNESNGTLDFSTSGLEFTCDSISLGDDRTWTRSLWDFEHSRCLQRNVAAGLATIKECAGTGGNFSLTICVLPQIERANIEALMFFETAQAAADAAESFSWITKEFAGVTWYQTRDNEFGAAWDAVLGEGDKVELSCYKGGDYHMKRTISVCYGMSYEMSAIRYDSGDSKLAVRTFAEAAAIAITLPSFLAVLGAPGSH